MSASLILLISVCIYLAIGVPVAFALGLSTVTALVISDAYPMLVLLKETFTGVDSFPLMAVPFFILAAELMSGGSLTEVLLKFAGQFVGHKRGGLGYTNVVSLTFFSGISGSALADAAGPGSMLIRMMDKAGYGRSYAAALTASTAIVGPIIPPSIIMIIYALADDNVSVGSLFIAGLIPGVIIAAAMCLVNYYISKQRNYKGDGQLPTGAEILSTTWKALPAILLLKGEQACVLLGIERGEARVLMPETGQGAVVMPRKEFSKRHSGVVLFVRPHFRFDERAPEVRATRASRGSTAAMSAGEPGKRSAVTKSTGSVIFTPRGRRSSLAVLARM